MTGDTMLVAYHPGLLSFGCLFQSLSMAFKAIFETQFLMHFDHLGVLAMANVAAGGFSSGSNNPCSDQQY